MISKNKNILNKIISIFTIILLLCVNSFAAVVSDNDGAAFVTKAEFEALKVSFTNQIENYNESIDGKIDGAIANYLAGIRLSKKEPIENLITNVENAMGVPVVWYPETWTGANYMDDTSHWINTIVQLVGHYRRIGSQTKGYATTLYEYNNGYMVLKKDTNILYACEYRPELLWTCTYLSQRWSGSTGVFPETWTEGLSSWSSIIGWKSTQKDTGTKYWLGYDYNYQNYDTASDLRGFRSLSLKTNITEKVINFAMAPLCTSTCGVWDVNSNASTAEVSSGSGYPGNHVYESSISGGTNSSSSVFTAITAKVAGPDWFVTLPWVSTGNVYNEQTLNLGGVQSVVCKMKYGLPLAKADRDGKIGWTMNLKAGKYGYYVHSGNKTDLSDLHEWSSIPNNQKFNYIVDTKVEKDIEVKKGDTVFVIYIPNNSDKLDVSYLYLEAE